MIRTDREKAYLPEWRKEIAEEECAVPPQGALWCS
jgi:hypothetical protein